MSFPARIAPLPLLTAICAALVLSGCGGAQSRKARHLEKGRAFMAAGNYEKARLEFRNALQIMPLDSEARYENGVADESLGNIREAAQFYQGAIDSNADNAAARARLGRIFALGGAPDKAIATVSPSLEKHPDDPKLLTVRASAKVQLQDTAGAQTDAERAVHFAPSDDDAVAVLAGVYKAEGQVDKAEALLRETIKRDPDTVELRLVLAQLEASRDQPAEVEALLLDLVRLRPAEKSHRLRLAQFYARTNHLDEAERTLREGVKALPQERALTAALVDFLATRRSREAAEKELDTLVTANPKDYELRFLQAQFYEQGKETAKAEAVYRTVIEDAKLEGPGIGARNRLAALRIELNDVPGAERLIAEVLAASPRDNDALILRGNLALAQKDPRTAIADLRSVLRDQPNAVGVMRTLARAHLANGEPALAEETMRRAVEANPKDAAAQLDLAQLLAQIGKPEQAKPVIDDLVKKQPGNRQALDLQFRVAVAVKDLVAAKSAADAIVATDPKAPLGYYYEGELAQADKHYEDAVRLFATALDVQPQATEPLGAMTHVLLQLQRGQEAIKRLDEVIARDPKAAFAPNLKGEALLSLQRGAEAQAAFRVAIERQPDWWVPYQNLAASQVEAHESAAGIATLRDGIAKAASPEQLETDLASLYEHDGNVDAGIEVYENALRRNPKSDVAANNLAMLLVTHKKDRQSLDRAKQLAAHFSDSPNPSFLDTYGWVLYKRGEAQAAVTALQAAASKTVDAPVALYHLGMAQALAGQDAAARMSLQRSIDSGKSFFGIDEAKAELDKLAKEAPSAATQSKS
jgi:tetratricopeptide (TPR) repeat protein